MRIDFSSEAMRVDGVTDVITAQFHDALGLGRSRSSALWNAAPVPSVADVVAKGSRSRDLRRFATVLSRGGGLVDIATDLAVLAAFALGLLMLATIRLRRGLLA